MDISNSMLFMYSLSKLRNSAGQFRMEWAGIYLFFFPTQTICGIFNDDYIAFSTCTLDRLIKIWITLKAPWFLDYTFVSFVFK